MWNVGMPIFMVLFSFCIVALGIFGWVMLVVNGFRASIAWGVCNLLIPGAFVVFAFTHKEEPNRVLKWGLRKGVNENIFFLLCVGLGILVFVT
jgi:hypothetical protein